MADIQMTRPEEVLATHDLPFGHSTTWIELDGGMILMLSQGGNFRTSDDGGVTWSDPIGAKDEDGQSVNGICLVRLNSGSIGLANIQLEAPDQRTSMSTIFAAARTESGLGLGQSG